MDQAWQQRSIRKADADIIGASINDYKRFVEQFYTPTKSTSVTSFENRSFQPPPNGYGRVQQLAWEWLTKNPEIWVGQNKEGNSLSLDQIEAREAELSTTLDQPFPTPQDQELELQQPAASSKQKATETIDAIKPFRIWTTRDRVWQTLTGHGVDFRRIPPMEFKALGFIAAAGQEGILQPELIHLTGQDKRSLPKRTDNLAKNGYIDKSAVWLKTQKTSLLRLTRFAPKETTEVFSNGRVMLDNFLRNLCEWVKEGDLILLSDLEEKLDCTTPGWEKTMLWRSLERLDIIGVIERFHRPTPVPAKRDSKINTVRVLKQRCIRLLKVPNEEDKHRYYTISRKDRDLFRQRLELQDAEAKKEHAEHGEDDEDYNSTVTPDAALVSLPRPETVAPNWHGQPALQWNPDLPYTNNMLNVLSKADSSGMSTMVC
jgi:B-block binding subunit of TFIIIC